jgi:hypothetical protein
MKRKQIREKTKFICDSDSIYTGGVLPYWRGFASPVGSQLLKIVG